MSGFPKIFCLSFQKVGTTSLHEFLLAAGLTGLGAIGTGVTLAILVGLRLIKKGQQAIP